jgi:flagellar motor switch protein FliG
MNIPVVNIGNSKGFRIPQMVLKECNIHEEVELKIHEGNIMLIPIRKREFSTSFENIPKMTDMEIQLMLRQTDPVTLAIALADADKKIKEKIYMNMSEKAKEMIKTDIKRIEKMDAKQIFIEIQRGKICKYLGT